MEKRILSVLFGMGILCIMHAQQLTPEIISSAGGIDKTAKISLEWTLGEPASSTIYAENYLLTEGFHQPVIRVEEIVKIATRTIEDSDLQFQVFPNPVRTVLDVIVQGESKTSTVLFILADVQGKQLHRQELDPLLDSQKIDMQNLSSGVYILNCMLNDGTPLQSFKIFKTR
jgi:hypothetical protein